MLFHPSLHSILYHPSLVPDIRRPEELSLLRPVEEKKKKKDKDLSEELHDLTEVPLTSGTQYDIIMALSTL